MVSLEIILMTAFFIAMLIVDPDLYIFLKAMYVKRWPLFSGHIADPNDVFAHADGLNRRWRVFCWELVLPLPSSWLPPRCTTGAKQDNFNLRIRFVFTFHDLDFQEMHCWDYAEGCYQNIMLLVVDMRLYLRHHHHHVMIKMIPQITCPSTWKVG